MHRLSGCSCQPSSLVEQAGGVEVKKVTEYWGAWWSNQFWSCGLVDYPASHAQPQHLGGLTPPGEITCYYLL